MQAVRVANFRKHSAPTRRTAPSPTRRAIRRQCNDVRMTEPKQFQAWLDLRHRLHDQERAFLRARAAADRGEAVDLEVLSIQASEIRALRALSLAVVRRCAQDVPRDEQHPGRESSHERTEEMSTPATQRNEVGRRSRKASRQVARGGKPSSDQQRRAGTPE
jgi:hypothetical protein